MSALGRIETVVNRPEADTSDSKSAGGNTARVRVPPQHQLAISLFANRIRLDQIMSAERATDI